MRSSAIIALLLLAGCTAAPPAIEFPVGDTALLVNVETSGTPRTEPGRASYSVEGGGRLTFQSMDIEARGTARRTPRDVAAAMAERYELGEGEGELAHRACRAGAESAECIDGWTTVEGRRYVRRGVIVEVGEAIVWIDVSAPEEDSAAAERVAEQVRSSLHRRGADREV